MDGPSGDDDDYESDTDTVSESADPVIQPALEPDAEQDPMAIPTRPAEDPPGPEHHASGKPHALESQSPSIGVAPEPSPEPEGPELTGALWPAAESKELELESLD